MLAASCCHSRRSLRRHLGPFVQLPLCSTASFASLTCSPACLSYPLPRLPPQRALIRSPICPSAPQTSGNSRLATGAPCSKRATASAAAGRRRRGYWQWMRCTNRCELPWSGLYVSRFAVQGLGWPAPCHPPGEVTAGYKGTGSQSMVGVKCGEGHQGELVAWRGEGAHTREGGEPWAGGRWCLHPHT